jgi:hypothetical protein
MTEKHTIKYNSTLYQHQQFQINRDKTNFPFMDKVENMHFGYNSLAYKIHRVGSRQNHPLFRFKENILFRNLTIHLNDGDLIEIIITDEPIENHGLTLAKK